ncbi:MAG: non-ribosomal peptide synthetase [Gemmatimonadaceae bacterium]
MSLPVTSTLEPLTGAALASEPQDQDVFVFPASFAQQRLWFLDQMEPSAVYNIPSAFRITGALDIRALERALNEIVARHESLRTTFAAPQGEPMQVIAPVVHVPVPVTDVGMLEPSEREAEAMRIARARAAASFDLARGPLVRAEVVRLADDDHLFALVVHHIVADGYSMGVLFRELTSLYEAMRAGADTTLPAVAIQYADYVMWQREWLETGVVEQQLGFWRQQLAGDLPVLSLPTDRPRPAVQTLQGDFLRLAIPRELMAALAELGRQESASAFMVLLAAFNVLLYRYTGQEDVLIGSPIANRDRAEIEQAIGFYTNTVVYRTDLSGSPTFRELLARVRKAALAVFSNQDAPFEKVVETVRPNRDLSHNPLFQVMFAMQKSPDTALQLRGAEIRSIPVGAGTSKFDMLFELQEMPTGLEGMLEFNTDLFDRATMTRLLEHFRILLEGIAADPARPISELRVLPPDERARILEEWNRTERTFAGPACIHELFEREADRVPHATAVVFEGESLSYAELERRANQLANRLRTLGVGPDVLVGLCVERSPEMLVALLGILKAGGAYLPLDPAYPSDRLAFMIEDSGIGLLVTSEALRDELPLSESSAATTHLVLVDGDTELFARAGDARPSQSAIGENLAYTIYTSGSTGRPKGVQIPHSAVVNFLNTMREAPGLDERDAFLAVTTLSFDIAGLELYLPLTVGARVVLASREVASDGVLLSELFTECGATAMQATPATYRLLLDAGWTGSDTLRALVGGEAVPRDLVDALRPRVRELWNMYGPTETTIWSTVQRLEAGAPVLIGRPIANTEVYVLDRNHQPTPIGVAGELYIGGTGLARGYLKRPELTAERFVPHPFKTGARLYRTGDLVRFTPDGAIEFSGRLDFQVKVRGFRIELGEIEAVLAQEPAVRHAVVTVHEDRIGDKRLVAYVVYHTGESLTGSELRRHLRDRLPDFMVPALVVELDALPLTQNGKVDRKALPNPFAHSSARDEDFVAARTPMEEFIAEVWRDVLGVERVGIRDNFFELGGHSLLSVRVLHRIESRIGCRLNPRAIVLQTLEQIAVEAEQRMAS